jgi:hypothetical protein
MMNPKRLDEFLCKLSDIDPVGLRGRNVHDSSTTISCGTTITLIEPKVDKPTEED